LNIDAMFMCGLVRLALSMFCVGGAIACLGQDQGVVRISTEEGYIEGSTAACPRRGARPDVEYHWLKGQRLQVTQGGFAGAVLHGHARYFGSAGQLLKEGVYRKGLRDGEWREWYSSGRLKRIEEWRMGRRSGWTRVYGS